MLIIVAKGQVEFELNVQMWGKKEKRLCLSSFLVRAEL